MKKPERSDLKYIAIEGFRDFEFFDCVAFEMAIRNKENFQALQNVIDYKYSDFEWNDFMPKYDMNSDNEKRQWMKLLQVDNEDMDKITYYGKSLKLLKNNGICMDELYDFFDRDEDREVCLKYFIETQHFTLEPNKILTPMTTTNVHKYVLLKTSNDYAAYRHLSKTQISKNHDRVFRNNDKTLKKNGLTSTTTTPINLEKFPETEDMEIHERTEINFEYQRPKLKFETNLNALVRINLGLPITEIEHQLRMLKNQVSYLNLHTDIDNAARKEIAGDNYFFDMGKNSKKHNRNKTYADLFFTYDYFNYMQPIIKRYNRIQKAKQDKEIAAIRKRQDLDVSDKKAMIDAIRDKYKGKKLSRQDILTEIENQIEQDDPPVKGRASKAEKHLAHMRKMIDELQYKEFITGIKNPPKNT